MKECEKRVVEDYGQTMSNQEVLISRAKDEIRQQYEQQIAKLNLRLKRSDDDLETVCT